jgi:hypothetical protein
MTLNINDSQHNNPLHYAECRVLFIVMLSVVVLNLIMLSVIVLNLIMLSVVMLNVVILSVVALLSELSFLLFLSYNYKADKNMHHNQGQCYKTFMSMIDGYS